MKRGMANLHFVGKAYNGASERIRAATHSGRTTEMKWEGEFTEGLEELLKLRTK